MVHALIIFFTKLVVLKKKCFKLTNAIIDHYRLFISIAKIRCTKQIEPTKYINPKKIKKIATQIDWGKTLTMHDPNAATDTLIQNILICINNSYETRKKKHNEKPTA